MIIRPRYYGPQMPTEYAVRVTSAAPNGITVADDADIDMATNNFGIALKRKLADWTPAVDTILLHKHDGTNGIIVTLLTTGIIRLTINLADYDASVATGLAANANEWAVLSVVRESASAAGSVTRYIAGSVLDAASAITAGTPATVSNASAMYIDGDSGEGFDVDDAGTILLNFAPAAAEVATLCTTGIPESWKWGSQAAKFTTDFSAGTNSFTGVSGATVTGNQDAVYGVNDAMLIESNGSANARARRSNFGGNLFPKTSITIQAVRPAANVTCTGIMVAITEDGSDSVYASFYLQISAADTWQTFLIPAFSLPSPVPTGRRIAIYPVTAANGTTVTSGDKVWVKALTTYQAGATFAALPETIPTSGALAWTDSSGNTGGGTLPAAGATKVTIRR